MSDSVWMVTKFDKKGRKENLAVCPTQREAELTLEGMTQSPNHKYVVRIVPVGGR